MQAPPLYVIPSDSPSVFDKLTSLQKQAIVRPNNPPPGIAGYLFDIPGDEELRLRTIITKHYTEENTPVTDQMALEPEEIKLRGLVAELSTGLPALLAPVQVPQTLPINVGILPIPSLGQMIRLVGIVGSFARSSDAAITSGLVIAAATALSVAANQAETASIATAAAQSAGTFFDNSGSPADGLFQYEQQQSPQQPNQTAQSNAAAYFYQLWKGRMLFSVETPFGVMNNMAILDAHIVQEATSRERSNFTITFQKVRIVGDTSTQEGQMAGRRVLQAAQNPATSPSPSVVGQQPLSAAQSTNLYQSFA